MLNLLLLGAAVGIAVWLLGLLPIPAPFQKVILVVGILIVVVACLQELLGVNLLGHLRSALR